MEEDWVQDCNFQLGIVNIVREREGYRGRLIGSGKDVSIWKISDDLKERAESFMVSSDENLLKVYLVGPLKKTGWYVVTEHIEETFSNWSVATNPRAVVNGEVTNTLSRKKFINPLASLIKSTISIMTRYGRDVSIDENTPIYVVKRINNTMEGEVLELKLGFYPFGGVADEEFLQGFRGIANLVTTWLNDYHGIFIPNYRNVFVLCVLLRSLPTINFWNRDHPANNRFHRLWYILESPFFLSFNDKARLWDTVYKMDNVERDIYSSTRQNPLSHEVMYVFQRVEAHCEPSHVSCSVMEATQWYFEDFSCPPLKRWFDYNEYYVPNRATGQQYISPALTFNWLIRSLRNFWSHASEYMRDPNDFAPYLATTIEEMIPGIWGIFHLAIMTSDYLQYFVGEVD